MSVMLKLLLAVISLSAYGACDFKSHIKHVNSLSGSATVVLKELGLLNNPRLRGISIFNPIAKSDFKGRIYPGGVFLSSSSIADFGGGMLIYDESRELRKVLSPISSIHAIEIKTRNLTPWDVQEGVLKEMSFLLEGCESAISSLRIKTKNLEQKILSQIKNRPSVVFYLGEIKNNRRPELVIVQDGVVKWLVQNNKIITYPSDLSYVSWSAKIINSLPISTLHVGIKDSGREMIKTFKKDGQNITLTYPGALVSGLTQLEAIDYLFRLMESHAN